MFYVELVPEIWKSECIVKTCIINVFRVVNVILAIIMRGDNCTYYNR